MKLPRMEQFYYCLLLDAVDKLSLKKSHRWSSRNLGRLPVRDRLNKSINMILPHPLTWLSHAFRAMGSHIVLWLDTVDDAAAANAFEQIEALFAANELALNRFRPDSELSLLNARSGQWVAVTDLLWRQVTLAVQVAALTDGRFDPTMLKALEQAGYGQSFDTMNALNGNGPWPEEEMLLGQWAAIEFDKANRLLRVPLGVHLDLGGIAKGDTAQQAVMSLQITGPCLVDAGGDLVAGTAPHGYPGWPVAISAPRTGPVVETEDLVTIWLSESALATSGVDYRHWMQNGKAMHHLIDPITGNPSRTDGLTCTVLAREAAVAEAWATATLVAGSVAGMDALLDHDLAGLFITQDGRILVTPPMDQIIQRQQAELTR